jgi:hypothetical protein
MSVGDEFGLTEDLYHRLIGRYVAAIEVLTQRLAAKDQHIAKIEAETKTQPLPVALSEVRVVDEEPKEGDAKYEE